MVRFATVFCFTCFAAAPQQPPVIRTATRLVQISVIVHDKNGPVANLTKEDFILTDQGKQQSIGVFAVEKTAPAPENPQPLAPNTFSNRARSGTPNSVTIVLLDSLNTIFSGLNDYSSFPSSFENGALAFAKQQALKFARELDPNERVAVYSLGKSLKVLCDFTGDRAQLLKVLGAYRDSSLTSRDMSDPEPFHSPAGAEFDEMVDKDKRNLAALVNGSRAATTLAALREIAAHVADIPGRKNLVWLTAEVPIPGAAAARVLHDTNIALYPVDARGLTASLNPHYIPKGLETLQDLADQTGGRAFYNNNDLSRAIHEAVEDANVTYTLGFYPEEASLDSQFHSLKVHVKRANLDLRYPKGYFAFKEPPVSERKTVFMRAVQSPLEASAIGFDAQVEREGAAFVISFAIDIGHLQLKQEGDLRKGAVEIYTVQQNRSGVLIEKKAQKIFLSLTPDQYLAYRKSGLLYREQIAPKPDFETLRLIVGDPGTGATGTLIIPASRIP
jgi:VWFA-related protein